LHCHIRGEPMTYITVLILSVVGIVAAFRALRER
jgi:hypothetical protein